MIRLTELVQESKKVQIKEKTCLQVYKKFMVLIFTFSRLAQSGERLLTGPAIPPPKQVELHFRHGK